MKKSVSVLLALLLCFFLYGCDMPFSDINKTVSEFADKAGIAYENGIVVSKRSSDSITKIKPVSHKNIDALSDCYFAVSEEQQVIYRYILAAAKEMPDGWIYCGNVTDNFENDVAIAYRAVLCDNPDIFWMPSSYVIATSSKNLCIAFSLDEDDIENDYIMDKKTRDNYRSVLEEKVTSLVNAVNGFSSDYEKEKYFHDYLSDNAKYDLDGGDMIYSSYGAIVDGVCVCEGFSRAFQLLLKRVGIDSVLVYGTYENEGHMWNRVKLDDAWYNVDITWDQNEQIGTLHYYFNISDKELKTDHIISPLRTSKDKSETEQSFNIILYNCNSDKYWYFNFENRILTDNTRQVSDIILKDYRANRNFSEMLKSTTNVENTLNNAAGILYGEVTLKRYSEIRKEVLVFFENTY